MRVVGSDLAEKWAHKPSKKLKAAMSDKQPVSDPAPPVVKQPNKDPSPPVEQKVVEVTEKDLLEKDHQISLKYSQPFDSDFILGSYSEDYAELEWLFGAMELDKVCLYVFCV